MINGETFLVLGGGGMIGAQVVHEIASKLSPKQIVICSRTKEESAEVIEHFGREFPTVQFSGFGGDVFVRASWNEGSEREPLTRAKLIESPETRQALFDDVFHDAGAAYSRSQLVKLILDIKPDVVIDSINTATAISYQDVYTGSEIARKSFYELKDAITGSTANAELRLMFETAERDFEALLISQSIPQLVRHVLLIHRAMSEAKTRLYLKIGTTGTGGMGLNIPYTHSEDKPSARLLTKTAMGFAHTGLMFLMARTPNGPIVKELKPAAMVGYNNITCQAIHERGKLGKPMYRFAAKTQQLPGELILREPDSDYEKLDDIRMAVVDTGENGLFTKGEFDAITHMGQMEFITPEEIANQAVLEVQGSNTGYDVIAAIDGAVMNPTYRAGCLRQIALDDVERLERSVEVDGGAPSVALGLLGPPELGKLLWEAYLLKLKYGTLKKVITAGAEQIAGELSAMLAENKRLGQTINAVGLPILSSDCRSLTRGPFIRIPEIPGANHVRLEPQDTDRWARKGWVDMRASNFEVWRQRFACMLGSEKDDREHGSSSTKREGYVYEDIRIGAVVAWIFNNESLGYRIK